MAAPTTARLPAGMRDAPRTTDSCRQEARHSFLINGKIDQVFGLFDPVSERDWVDDLDPIPVFPEELSRDAGTVFTLERDGRTAVWTVLRHSPADHVAEYLVTEYDYQHRWIFVSCTPETADTTRVAVHYVTTALSAAGQQDVGRYGETFLRAWEQPVQNAINQLAG